MEDCKAYFWPALVLSRNGGYELGLNLREVPVGAQVFDAP